MELVNQIIGGLLGISLGVNIILFFYLMHEMKHSRELERRFFILKEIHEEREKWLETWKENE